jgi:prepilin-type N-terminal cleavage/methylation domain-containing protein
MQAVHPRRGFKLVELSFDRLRIVSKRKRCAFTLVELLVVIAIIGILVALLLKRLAAASVSTTSSNGARHCIFITTRRNGCQKARADRLRPIRMFVVKRG